jgi:hypothetical protein
MGCLFIVNTSFQLVTRGLLRMMWLYWIMLFAVIDILIRLTNEVPIT